MSESQPHRWRLNAHFAFWTLAVAVAFFCSLLAGRGLWFAGVPPVPLKANPVLLTIAVGLIPCVAFFTWYVFSKKHLNLTLSLPIFCLLPIGIVISSIHPGTGSIIARDLVQTTSLQRPGRVFAMPAYFANGIEDPAASEIKRLADAFSTFRECEAGTLRVKGFASSRPYAGSTIEQSNERNKSLANDRAKRVAELLEKSIGRKVEAVPWPDYYHMQSERRIRDIDLSGNALLDAERLNRRVEIYWNDSPCAPA
jgi:hypothetical protein